MVKLPSIKDPGRVEEVLGPGTDVDEYWIVEPDVGACHIVF